MYPIQSLVFIDLTRSNKKHTYYLDLCRVNDEWAEATYYKDTDDNLEALFSCDKEGMKAYLNSKDFELVSIINFERER